ncbi:glycosyltransferase [Acuticoccus sediminis]|uniref:Glycosyltransferase n=1 Tax=Acuticoccus sediminis TaxID=2184697 RepID=A0A8B2NNS9_9HYPH|nr:WecB/TagA/CpsF family glycosyltransferase [Acuticoccus sediminis]RAH98329.1 glycosyltransferase [Acuticoccus sediminis]
MAEINSLTVAHPLERRSGGPASVPPATVARVNVLGVAVSALDLGRAVRRILAAVAAGERGYVCVCGAHGVIECRDDEALRQIHNDAFLVTPDGMPLVWALRQAGHEDAGRVYGPDLMAALVRAGQDAGLRHYLYGATDETLAALRDGLSRIAPAARIVGSFSPPFRPLTGEEEEAVATAIDVSGADIVWVGLSTPKQERWMARMRPLLGAPMLIGVGAAFDFHAGRKRQAPRVLQTRGLEWAFRLASEPRRLARRYGRVVPRYLYLRSLQRLGLKSFPIAETHRSGAPLPRISSE